MKHISPDFAKGVCKSYSTLLQSLLAAQTNADAALQEQLLERTGGVPSLLVSCAQALRVSAEEGVPPRRCPGRWWRRIRQRVAVLPPAAHEVLGVAAVVGREVPGALLLALATQPQAETVAALEALDRARLLVECEQACYQFPYELIRDVVLADLSALRRHHWHAQVAAALSQGPERRAGHAAELARHWLEAGDAKRALPDALLAEWHAQTARDLARDLSDKGREAQVQEKLGGVGEHLARSIQTEVQSEAALALYQGTGDVEG